MGRKITIDSATLANKALEVIEAHFLSDLPYDRIEVVVHPQSVVHSFVEFVDGSVLAQMGVPSMELPVLYALTHPERVDGRRCTRRSIRCAFAADFRAGAITSAFPRCAWASMRARGGAAPAVFNAANEQAVALFLAGKIRFADIAAAIDPRSKRLSELPSADRASSCSTPTRQRAGT